MMIDGTQDSKVRLIFGFRCEYEKWLSLVWTLRDGKMEVMGEW